MTEMGFFVLGFTVCLAILMVSDTVSQAIAAEVKMILAALVEAFVKGAGLAVAVYMAAKKK